MHGLWKTGTACVLDVAIVNTDSKSYKGRKLEKCLALAGKGKKVMYEAACLERRRTFMLLIYLVDGMAGTEARAFDKRIMSLLATKWDRPYSEMVGYVRGRMSLAVVRANTMVLRGARSSKRFIPAVEDAAAYEFERELTSAE